MTVFGVDVSHHQGNLDFKALKREGIEFAFIKATEGATFTDALFSTNLAKARAAGMLVGAYHYVRSNSTVAAQIVNISRAVPKDVPVILDIEANSVGGAGLGPSRDIINTLRALDYSVPLTYLPKWYWQQIGQPPLTGLPPLWSSRYPDNVVGTLASEWSRTSASYWTGYGGLSVEVLQFTSSASIAGHAPLDANAYRGTKTQLAALLGGQPPEEDMSLSDEYFEFVPPGETAMRRVKAIDALANLYIERFFGSGTAPWTGPSGRALDLTSAAKQVADVDEDALAAAMAAQGIGGGATPAQVKAALQEVLALAAGGAV